MPTSDFIIYGEQVGHPTVWIVGKPPTVSSSTLYGRNLYGVALYSGIHNIEWVNIPAATSTDE